MAPFDSEVHAGAVCCIVSPVHAQTERTFGFAVFYEETRLFQICEFTEDSHASRSEALLLQLMPQKLVNAVADPQDCKRVARIAESCGVDEVDVKSSECTKQVDLDQDLKRLLEDAAECGLSKHLEELKRKQGMRALAVLIGHCGLLNEPANIGACSLGMYPLSNFLYLDKAAFAALNVLPRPEESLRSNSSLLGFLNRCRSPIGQRRLRQWISQPLTSPDEIKMRHDVVEALSRSESLLRQVEANLRRVPDLERLAARFHRTPTASKGQKASLEDLVSVYQCVRVADSIVQNLNTYEGIHHEIVANLKNKIASCLADFTNFKSLVEQIVDLEQAEQRNFCINRGFDVSLGNLASQRDNLKDQMEVVRKTVDDALRLQGKGNDRAVGLTEQSDRWVFRATKKHQQAIQHFKGKPQLKVLTLKKLEVVFTTAELEKLDKELKQATRDYDQQSAQLVKKALGVASTYAGVIDRVGETLANLDVLASFARVVLSAPCNFVRAQIDDEGKQFHIEGAQHILVVVNTDRSFVANNLDMKKESSRLHLITGPNMGGKSTYIRSVALIVLMNQIGCFVPCLSAKLPIFDALMCRVGASDMQLRGISTFMAEMLEASCILNTASDRTLVIVDELGRGTSTSDGFGIAWAIAKHLAETTRCYTLFATHFHELAALEEATQGVKNRHATAAVDAASGQLTFLYSLADGPAEQSYGANVAELAGFPDRVVAASRKKAVELEAQSSCNSSLTTAERVVKRARLEDDISDPLGYIGAATVAADFAQRALQSLPNLKKFLQAGV